jgi:hypothetical protein
MRTRAAAQAGHSRSVTESVAGPAAQVAISRALLAVVLVACVSTGCTASPQRTRPTTAMTLARPATPARQAQPTTPASPAVAASAPACSAAQGSLVPSAAPFVNVNRLIQPFGYVNNGLPCYVEGFPVVQLYDTQHQLLNVPEVDGDIVLGTAVPARYLLPHDNVMGGFNVETPTSGSCVTASYVSASFGGGGTPLVAIDYQVCGTLYLTPFFE